MNKKCIFCEIYRKREGIIYENKYFYAIFDRFPVLPGHIVVISKSHRGSLLDLTKEEWEFLKPAIAEAIKVIEKTDGKKLYEEFWQNPVSQRSKWFCKKMLQHPSLKRKPDGYNIGINEGEAAGKTIDHLHIHIIPRYLGDVKDPTGGVRNIIPGMGNYKS